MRKVELPVSGGCACGKVRYEVRREPMTVHCCHCYWCQRETGSAFVLNAMLEAEEVVLTSGEPVIINTPSASGKGQKIARCPDCKVALWSHYAGAGTAVKFLRVGTLDTPDAFPPEIHVFTASKQDWVVIDPKQPQFEAFYDLKAVWSDASMARVRALGGPG